MESHSLTCTMCSDSDEDVFTFDASLLQDYCSPKVEATKMSINNLTYDNLKAELSKMEQRLEEYAKQHAEKVWEWEWGCAGNGDVQKGWEWECREGMGMGMCRRNGDGYMYGNGDMVWGCSSKVLWQIGKPTSFPHRLEKIDVRLIGKAVNM